MIDVSDLIGIPYKEHGRDKNGYDCYGLVIEVEHRYGNELDDFDYQAVTDRLIGNSVTVLESQKHIEKIDGYAEGAIVLFSNQAGFKNHIGVYVGDGKVIHCNYKGVHLDRLDTVERFISGVYVWRK